MYTSKQSRKLLLLATLFLCSNVVEARSSHQSGNKGHKFDRGQQNSHSRYNSEHHSSYRQYRPLSKRRAVLPASYLALTFAGLHYYYNSGSYYRRIGHEYAAVRPPFGLGISILPAGYRTMYHGRNRYYAANGIFYRWNDLERNYIVVNDPTLTSVSVPTGATISSQYIYPRQGQGAGQTARDRYECYLWAANQSGVEPARLNYGGDSESIHNYQRANSACLEARGYSVK